MGRLKRTFACGKSRPFGTSGHFSGSLKEKINIIKHGIDFSTAAKVFADKNRIELYDEAHSDFEDRFITIGAIGGIAYAVMVVYTERGEAIRLISARKATNQERRMYYDYSQRN